MRTPASATTGVWTRCAGRGAYGAGPVPYAHEPNRGFLRALYALGRAAAGIGESEEVERIRTFLRDSDPTAEEQIEADQGRARG